jgi:hypothetical protein
VVVVVVVELPDRRHCPAHHHFRCCRCMGCRCPWRTDRPEGEAAEAVAAEAVAAEAVAAEAVAVAVVAEEVVADSRCPGLHHFRYFRCTDCHCPSRMGHPAEAAGAGVEAELHRVEVVEAEAEAVCLHCPGSRRYRCCRCRGCHCPSRMGRRGYRSHSHFLHHCHCRNRSRFRCHSHCRCFREVAAAAEAAEADRSGRCRFRSHFRYRRSHYRNRFRSRSRFHSHCRYFRAEAGAEAVAVKQAFSSGFESGRSPHDRPAPGRPAAELASSAAAARPGTRSVTETAAGSPFAMASRASDPCRDRWLPSGPHRPERRMSRDLRSALPRRSRRRAAEADCPH